MRRLPHDIAAAIDRNLPGAEGDCDLLKLRPDFVLHAGYGVDGRGLEIGAVTEPLSSHRGTRSEHLVPQLLD